MGATYRYDLDNNGRKEEISWEPNPWSRLFVPRPHSTVQILLNYCKEAPQGELNEDEYYYMSCFT
jgi:hypothetical protein